MGGWKLEVMKMGIYMAFPVGLFHLFHQPEFFENWVKDVRREIYPPENPIKREMIQNVIREMQKNEDLKLLATLEERSGI